jgi:tRNA (Thr-GGU) A37 N-methylase
MDDKPHGIFATRSPIIPSGIGLSIVEIIKIENNQIFFKGVDMLNNTPLLDIKPYVPEIDCHPS